MTTNNDKPKLQFTRDYAMFDLHEHNRRQHADPVLLESMKRHGFMPSSPIQCIRTDARKLKIIRGHHRFDCAKQLGIGLWYVVDASNTDLFTLEATRQAWSADDFAFARAVSGNEDCAMAIDFKERHGLTLGSAVSLVGGESANSNNKVGQLKKGTFKASPDQSHALQVVAVTDYCRELGMKWATTSAFVGAVSSALRIPEFSPSVFMRRIATHGFAVMNRRATRDGCLEEIEKLYNYTARDKRLAVVFRAKEVARARSAASKSAIE